MCGDERVRLAVEISEVELRHERDDSVGVIIFPEIQQSERSKPLTIKEGNQQAREKLSRVQEEVETKIL